MSSMPAPIETAGRGTRRGADTAWQSIIVTAECLRSQGPVNNQPSRRGAESRGPSRTARFAVSRWSLYHR
jgi:hypothetical protein